MKKRNHILLRLNKKSISSLDYNSISGGAHTLGATYCVPLPPIPTDMPPIPNDDPTTYYSIDVC